MSDIEHIRKDVEAIVDNLGKPVDPSIKELVIGLMAHGIVANGSCEGHRDNKGKSPFPWVDVPYECAEKVAILLAQQNRPMLNPENPNLNYWTIRPGTELRIIPQNQNLPLEQLQEYAKRFGLFLQYILTRDN